MSLGDVYATLVIVSWLMFIVAGITVTALQ